MAIKYSEALELDTSSGGSDADTLRLKAGVIVDFLDWALPQRPLHSPSMGEVFTPGHFCQTAWRMHCRSPKFEVVFIV